MNHDIRHLSDLLYSEDKERVGPITALIEKYFEEYPDNPM